MATQIQFASELRDSVIAIELRKQSIGKTKVMNCVQKQEIASHFDSDYHAVASSKRLFHPQQPQIKRINTVLNEARFVWVNHTIAYAKGIRLIRKDCLDSFVRQFELLEIELDKALQDADNNYDRIIDSSRQYLNSKLFDIRDYPQRFAGSVTIAWSVHNFEPSEELLRLAPQTYKREQERVRKQFEQAMVAYEIEAKEQLAGLCDSLLNSLSTPKDGKRQVFKEATANNLRNFFERFRTINITSDSELNELVSRAENALGNITMSSLKNNYLKRETVKDSFESIKRVLSDSLEDMPVRSISFDSLED